MLKNPMALAKAGSLTTPRLFEKHSYLWSSRSSKLVNQIRYWAGLAFPFPYSLTEQ